MSTDLTNIKSQYIIIKISYFINYEHLLKLIKNNKKLQTRLGVNILNYKKKSSYRYLTCQAIWKSEVEDNQLNIPLFKQMIICLIGTILGFILFAYSLVFASLLVSKGDFNENNTKDDYNKHYFKIIHRINLSLFGFLAYVLIAYFFIFCFIPNTCAYDYGRKVIIRKIVMIIVGILLLLYDIIIIIKLDLSYKIKKDKITWFMICDYILIILIILYLSIIIYVIYLYFEYSGELAPEQRTIILQKFRDIKILDYKLPFNFNDFNDYQKRVFLLKNINDYVIELTKEQKALISSINEYRKENNIDELHYIETVEFKALIFEKYTEPILNDKENIFKLSKGKYLLKYPQNIFEIRFKNRDSNIINILLNDYLNKIIIIDKDNISYIFIFHFDKKDLSVINREEINETSEILRVFNDKKYRSPAYQPEYRYEDFKYYEG